MSVEKQPMSLMREKQHLDGLMIQYILHRLSCLVSNYLIDSEVGLMCYYVRR